MRFAGQQVDQSGLWPLQNRAGKHPLTQLSHGDIAEIPISQGLDRKLKITKAKEMKTSQSLLGKDCLIEIDIRNQAIGLAKEEMKLINDSK